MALLLLAGCSDESPERVTAPPDTTPTAFESDYRSWIAGIHGVTTPDFVDVGSEFEVVMLSYAPDGCWRVGRSVVLQVNPLSVTIIPFVEEYVGENPCTQNAPTLRHSIYLLASVKGTFEVNVPRAGGGVIQRTVVVR
jgi:hypothetical protein